MTTETVLKPVSPGMGRGAVRIVFEMVFKICALSVDSLDTKESESEVAQLCLTVTPWTIAHQVPPSMVFSRQEY